MSVHAIVTKTKSGTQRLFICTKSPDELNFDFTASNLGKASLFAKSDVPFLPLTVYSMRWHIEVAYYEQKKFWSFGAYMLRSKVGIERLTNLFTVLYAFMTILPFYDDTFLSLAHNSPQQSRFVLGMTVWHELFLTAFDNSHIFSKKYIRFCLFTYISYSFFRNIFCRRQAYKGTSARFVTVCVVFEWISEHQLQFRTLYR